MDHGFLLGLCLPTVLRLLAPGIANSIGEFIQSSQKIYGAEDRVVVCFFMWQPMNSIQDWLFDTMIIITKWWVVV